MEIKISEFKAKCIEMLKSASEGGEELVITRRGKPLARVTGVSAPAKRVLGGQAQAMQCDPADEDLIRSDFDNDWN